VEVRVREAGKFALLDLFGPISDSEDELQQATEVVRQAIMKGYKPIFVFHDIDFMGSVDLGRFIRILAGAKVPMGALGGPPIVKIVSDNPVIGEIFSVPDTCFRFYNTEEEAIAPYRELMGGCLPLIAIAVLFVVLLGVSWCRG
jgi:hypothetical protein